MAKIKAPNRNFSGEAYGLNFVNGVAETSDKWTIIMLEEVGCTVEANKKAKEVEAPKEEETAPKE